MNRKGRSKARGNQWEREVEGENRQLYRLGFAKVSQTPDRVRIERKLKDGQVLGKMLRATDVDFNGVLSGGRAVSFDAKRSAAATRFPFALLKSEQVKWLQDVVAFGGVAFVYVYVDAHQKPGDAGLWTPAKRYLFPVDDSGKIAGFDYWDEDARRSIPGEVFPEYLVRQTWYQSVLEQLEKGAWDYAPTR